MERVTETQSNTEQDFCVEQKRDTGTRRKKRKNLKRAGCTYGESQPAQTYAFTLFVLELVASPT